MAETLRSRFIMAGRVKTHYSEIGDNGPPLVLLHGGGAGSSGEAGFGKIMPSLSPHLQVYAIDSVGGFGKTDTYAPVPYGVQSREDHLEDFIDALCLDELYLGGNSQGAWVAAKYALQHPDRVRKLCLVASGNIAAAMGVPRMETEGQRILRAYDGTHEAMRRLLEVIVADKSVITEELVEARQASANRPGAAEARKALAQNSQRFISDPGLSMNFDMSSTLPKLPIPTIFIWGEEDAFAPPELGHALEKLLPNVRFHWVPKAGHQVQNDQPEAVSKIMIDFFGS